MKSYQVAAFFALLALLALLASISPARAWDNLLQNPGFEEGTTGWRASKGYLSIIDIADLVHGGSQAAEFVASDDLASMWQVVQVQPGGNYTFSGYAIKNDDNISAMFLRISFFSGAMLLGSYNSSPLQGTSDEYRPELLDPPWSVSATAPTEADSARVEVMLNLIATPTGPATAYFDDMSFTGPPPTPSPSPSPTPTPSPGPSPTPTPTLSLSPSPTPTSSPPPAGTIANEGDLVLNEVQYDPPQSGADGAYEWVELFNRTATTINLEGWQIRDNRESDPIPPLALPANGFAVIAATEEGFCTNFPDFDGTVVFVEDGLIGNGLSNEGDRLTLEDSEGRLIDALSYGDDASQNPHCPDVAQGHSLERSPAGGEEFVDNPDPTPGYGLSPAPTPTETPVETQTPATTPAETPTAASPGGPAPEPSAGATLSGMALRGVGIALAIALFGILFWAARRRGSRK